MEINLENRAVHEVIKKEEPEDTEQLTILISKEKDESMENSPSASEPSPGRPLVAEPEPENSPPPGPSSIKSASKPKKRSLGLPDQSGLIVGVNTINYDASTSIRNKTKTRDELKLEQIMKRFKAMENSERKAKENKEKEERKRKKKDSDETETENPKKPKRQTGLSGAGESQDQSSADEGYGGGRRPSGISRGRSRKRSASLSGVRRQSRAKSGDSSAMSETETETADEIVGDDVFRRLTRQEKEKRTMDRVVKLVNRADDADLGLEIAAMGSIKGRGIKVMETYI